MQSTGLQPGPLSVAACGFHGRWHHRREALVELSRAHLWVRPRVQSTELEAEGLAWASNMGFPECPALIPFSTYLNTAAASCFICISFLGRLWQPPSLSWWEIWTHYSCCPETDRQKTLWSHKFYYRRIHGLIFRWFLKDRINTHRNVSCCRSVTRMLRILETIIIRSVNEHKIARMGLQVAQTPFKRGAKAMASAGDTQRGPSLGFWSVTHSRGNF